MRYKTIVVEECLGGLSIMIDRPDSENSINETLLKELNDVFDAVEGDPKCRILVLKGQNGVFCTGMDFGMISEWESASSSTEACEDRRLEAISSANRYINTLKRMTLIPKVIISVVDGRAIAGGIGLAAASDLVIATPKSQFALPEALWGLLPAMVAPYMMRRTGFQATYRMTLTTMSVSAREAYESHLVDEISEQPDEVLKRYWLRLSRLEETTIVNLKRYFESMWPMTGELMEKAVQETARLASDPRVIRNITNYVKNNRFPWEKG